MSNQAIVPYVAASRKSRAFVFRISAHGRNPNRAVFHPKMEELMENWIRAISEGEANIKPLNYDVIRGQEPNQLLSVYDGSESHNEASQPIEEPIDFDKVTCPHLNSLKQLSDKVECIAIGRELGKEGASAHYQGFVYFQHARRQASVLNLLRTVCGGLGVVWCAYSGDYLCRYRSALEYAKKESLMIEFGQIPPKFSLGNGDEMLTLSTNVERALPDPAPIQAINRRISCALQRHKVEMATLYMVDLSLKLHGDLELIKGAIPALYSRHRLRFMENKRNSRESNPVSGILTGPRLFIVCGPTRLGKSHLFQRIMKNAAPHSAVSLNAAQGDKFPPTLKPEKLQYLCVDELSYDVLYTKGVFSVNSIKGLGDAYPIASRVLYGFRDINPRLVYITSQRGFRDFPNLMSDMTETLSDGPHSEVYNNLTETERECIGNILAIMLQGEHKLIANVFPDAMSLLTRCTAADGTCDVIDVREFPLLYPLVLSNQLHNQEVVAPLLYARLKSRLHQLRPLDSGSDQDSALIESMKLDLMDLDPYTKSVINDEGATSDKVSEEEKEVLKTIIRDEVFVQYFARTALDSWNKLAVALKLESIL